MMKLPSENYIFVTRLVGIAISVIVIMVMIFMNAMQVIIEWDSMVETILTINEQDIRTDFGTNK